MKYKKKTILCFVRSGNNNFKIKNTEVNNNVPDALPGRYVYNQNFFFKSTYLISAQLLLE